MKDSKEFEEENPISCSNYDDILDNVLNKAQAAKLSETQVYAVITAIDEMRVYVVVGFCYESRVTFCILWIIFYFALNFR